MANESETSVQTDILRRFQEFQLDLNLDEVTAKEAWQNYESLKLRYDMEGDQLIWVACSVYTACMQRVLPTVGGKPGSTVQGNCISFTRILQHCNLTFDEFVKKQRLWLKMMNLDQEYSATLDNLESKFAVSNHMFRKFKIIFRDLFNDPDLEPKRPPRSRKSRKPPCNVAELYDFTWNLFILAKGKYPRSRPDIISSYSLLLSCIDLLYMNVKCMDRTDLLNPNCKGYPEGIFSETGCQASSLRDSVLEYLCKKYDCFLLETKVVQDYHLKSNIKELIEKKLLKGIPSGLSLIDCSNFDHNVKEVKNAYDADLLTNGEFDERMFLSNDGVLGNLVSCDSGMSPVATGCVTPMPDQPKRGGMMLGDHHFMPQTPISGRQIMHTPGAPSHLRSPMTATLNAVQKLYSLLRGKKAEPSAALKEMLKPMSNDPLEFISKTLQELGATFISLYTTDDNSGRIPPDHPVADLRLKLMVMLFYSFLENVIPNERARGQLVEQILKQDIFLRALFVCCVEIVLKCYGDKKMEYPKSLEVGKLSAFHFFRIIEPIVRSEQQNDNRLPRDLVQHLKRLEEQTLDSLAWSENSPIWGILKQDELGVPSCKDVNFSYSLDNTSPENSNIENAGTILSDSISTSSVIKYTPITSPRKSPLSTAASERLGLQSPPMGGKGSAKRTRLFSSATWDKNSPTTVSIVVNDNNSPKPETPIGERPRRHGSLAIFFRKVYNIANLRLQDLWDKLSLEDLCNNREIKVDSDELRRKIWTFLEYSIQKKTHLLLDRNLDHLIMCAVYVTCKSSGVVCTFQEILKQYRFQPQASSHIYRSVLIRKLSESERLEKQAELKKKVIAIQPSKRLEPKGITGTSTDFGKEERGDLIYFYNKVFMPNIKDFTKKFLKNTTSDSTSCPPPLSPLLLVRRTPVSPRTRISTTHPVYVRHLSPGATNLSQKYTFRTANSKDVPAIKNGANTSSLKRPHPGGDTNGVVAKKPLIGLSRRLNSVMDERSRFLDGGNSNDSNGSTNENGGT